MAQRMLRREALRELGVSSDYASEHAIKQAYRKQAIKWHPDKNAGNAEEATERFKRIARAYEALCEEQQIICQFFSAEDFLYAADEGNAEDVRDLLDADVDLFTT